MILKDKLEQDLLKYKKIFLISAEFSRAAEALDILKKADDVLIYTSHDATDTDMHIEKITPEQERELLDLYYLYEFSDKFVVITESTQYGTVWNYVNAGLITLEEAVTNL